MHPLVQNKPFVSSWLLERVKAVFAYTSGKSYKENDNIYLLKFVREFVAVVCKFSLQDITCTPKVRFVVNTCHY